MTIHNIRFQGTWNVGHLKWVTGLPDMCFQPGLLVSPYQNTSIPQEDWNCSMLRGGLVYSDFLTTVSNSYAQEIQTPNFGDGLDDILKWRSSRLWGIINGIDYSIWNPSKDTKIEANYNITTVKKGKSENKLALQKRLGLKENKDIMTISIISRLTDQKGLDLVDNIMDQLCSKEINLIVLGTGDPHYENMFRYYAGKYPGKVSANICYDEEMSHMIYAGSDALLVPSAFEPCGLTQLIAEKYGTIPIVHEIGGLKDSVKPFNQFENTGTGFTFSGYSGWELMDRINHALWVYYDRPKYWIDMVKRAMKEDWSWNNSSKIYENLYNSALALNN